MKPSRAGTGALTIDDLWDPAEGADRRAEPRIPRQRVIAILPCSTEPKWDFKNVMLWDCSRHGLAILTDGPMKPGDEFLAKVKIQRMTMVIYRVRHCETLADGRYKIGATLVEFVGTPDQILQALLAAEDAEANG